jgi:hypothetical protein
MSFERRRGQGCYLTRCRCEFVKGEFEGIFEPGVAEVTDEEDNREAEKVDDEDGTVAETGQKVGDEPADKFKDEEVRKIDGIGPIADGFEEGVEADEAGAFEFDGCVEKKG